MDLQVGDRVKLSKQGLRGFDGQSRGGGGTVDKIYEKNDWRKFHYRVRWDYGGYYVYKLIHLDLIEPDINEEELYY